MMKHLRYMAAAALATVGTACSEGPTDVNDEFEGELVITEGIAAPEYFARERPMLSDLAFQSASLGGSATTPLTLKPSDCGEAPQTVVVTFSITGNQDGTATFKVNTTWVYNGSAWVGSDPVTLTVPPRAGGAPATTRTATLSVFNGSLTTTGTATLQAPAFGLTNDNQQGGKLDLKNAKATVHVAFADCPIANTAPALVLPDNMAIEATSSAGALGTFVVTATDAQDGDISGAVTCNPASGATFALGVTTVNCSVTDNGGLSANGSFTVTVKDTRPAFFSSFPIVTVNLVAANINGAVLDIDALGITVEDVGGVSEPSTFSCDYVAGTVLAIGTTTDVDCTAKDAIGNESAVSTFQVFVGLNVNATGFLPPLRMVAPFSAHKRGSTIPHKFLPPTYADGTPALDLADGLNLAIRHLDWQPEADAIPVNDYSTGSTEWRYDPESGHYIFNLKSQSGWATGSWNTTVAFAGIPLATTQFDLKK